jgi:hypothetical protein
MHPRRPGPLSVLAILNIVVGGLGVAGTLMAALNYMMYAAAPNPAPTAVVAPGVTPAWKMDQYLDDRVPARHAIALLSHAASVVGFTMLIISGAGLLHVRRWAWFLALVYVVWNVLHTIAFVTYNFGVLLPAMRDYVEQEMQKTPNGMFAVFPSAWRLSFDRAWTIAWTIPGGYPIVVLCLLFVPPVSGAFRPEGDLPQVGWGRDDPRRDDDHDRPRYRDDDDYDRPPRYRDDDDYDQRRWAPRRWD